MMPTLLQRPARRLGVSLVEALVALAIMSIGMLALVGVQSTMRLNSDLAKQRTEATRIASEEIERLRSFTSMGVVPGQTGVSYDEIVDRVVESYQPPGGIGNTTYRVVRNITDLAGSAQKVVSVQVQWTDRTNQQQTVTLDSVINGTVPILGAMLAVPYRESATSRNRGRHGSIPEGATDLGDGSSRFQPPGASSGVGWYFNNLTGVLRVCAAVVVDYTTCPLATLVSGTVQFHITDTQPNAEDAEQPQGPVYALAAGPNAMALVDPVGNSVATSCYSLLQSTRVLYYCAVSTSTTTGWGGQLNPVPVDAGGTPLPFGPLASSFKNCRFTADVPSADDRNAQFTFNANHPLMYCRESPPRSAEKDPQCYGGNRVKTNLINQNFLIISGQHLCPTENVDNPTDSLAQGFTDNQNRVFINTRQHQPAP